MYPAVPGAVKLGMDKARAKGKPIGRPVVVDIVDAKLVVQLRQEGKSWSQIAEALLPETLARFPAVIEEAQQAGR